MKSHLICIDSDGCAMDTMNVKHEKCFAPALSRVWNLSPQESYWEKRWNQLNLYSEHRGINRFKGLALLLAEIDQTYKKIPGLQFLSEWTASASQLSAQALKAYTETHANECLKSAIEWSDTVNQMIQTLEMSFKPFPHVDEILRYMKQRADIVVVSSANRSSVEREWQRHGLLQSVTEIMTQEDGPKEQCIEKVLKKGYSKDKTIMIGDAPGDLNAAQKNQIAFYPILAGHETESWARLRNNYFDLFYESEITMDLQMNLVDNFWKNLN